MASETSESGWEYIVELAGSGTRDSRHLSLIKSYSWVEHALGACGLRRNEKLTTTAQLLRAAFDKEYLPKSLKESDITQAITIRHKAAHVGTVPPPNECLQATRTLRDVWLHLRKSQVTLGKAMRFADLIARTNGVTAVMLYGSLARREQEPHDIDFLVFDDGRYSRRVVPEELAYVDEDEYSESEPQAKGKVQIDRAKASEKCLSLLGLWNHAVIPEFVKCRWIDVTILDGNRFGLDDDYTAEVTNRQPDKYFFLNISSDILKYDRYTHSFVADASEIFKGLREIQHQLSRLLGTNRHRRF